MKFKISYEARKDATATLAEVEVEYEGNLDSEEAYVTANEFALKDSKRFHGAGQGAVSIISIERISV